MALDVTSYLLGEKSGGGGGTSNYSQLTNKPLINSVELDGNKTSTDLGLQDTLVSGTNIKTINNTSLLGSGDITISGGASAGDFAVYRLAIAFIVNQNSYTQEAFYVNTTLGQAFFTILNDAYQKDKIPMIIANIGYQPIYFVGDKKLSELPSTGDYQLDGIFATGDASNVTDQYNKNYFGRARIIASLKIENDEVVTRSGTGVAGYITRKMERYLPTDNEESFTPSANYHPATKKYVDDAITSAVTTTLGGSY